MAGYDPNCRNCHRCSTCWGQGTVKKTRMERGRVSEEKVTCHTCRGAGGRRGSGAHDHR